MQSEISSTVLTSTDTTTVKPPTESPTTFPIKSTTQTSTTQFSTPSVPPTIYSSTATKIHALSTIPKYEETTVVSSTPKTSQTKVFGKHIPTTEFTYSFTTTSSIPPTIQIATTNIPNSYKSTVQSSLPILTSTQKSTTQNSQDMDIIYWRIISSVLGKETKIVLFEFYLSVGSLVILPLLTLLLCVLTCIKCRSIFSSRRPDISCSGN